MIPVPSSYRSDGIPTSPSEQHAPIKWYSARSYNISTIIPALPAAHIPPMRSRND